MLNYLKKLFKNLINLGVLETDNQALKLKKISITALPIIVAPLALIWSVLYFVFDYTLPAMIALVYVIVSAINLFTFYKTKNITTIQKSQMLMLLIIPFILMWSLGGFWMGSFVMSWAFFAPITALIHERKESSQYWLYSFIALILFSALINQVLIDNHPQTIDDSIIELFIFLNITFVLSSIYFLLKYNLIQKDKNSNEQIQMKHDALLNNTKQLYNNISYLESYKHNIDYNFIVTRTDINGIITFANKNFYKLTGYIENEVIGQTHKIIRHNENSPTLYKNIWETILDKKTWHGRLKNRKKDGSTYWIDTTISPILNKDGEIVEFIAVRHDITKLIQHQNELTDMLYLDSLTGLKNRHALLKDLNSDKNLFLTLVNIDNFRQINNLYGEKFGNSVLIEFSKTLLMFNDKDIGSNVYRLSGDEFVILSPKENHLDIYAYIENLLYTNNSTPLHIDDQEIQLSITVGTSIESNKELLSTANMALTTAKRDSKSNLVYSDRLSLSGEYENNLKWIKEIKDAIKEDRITLYFQPIVDSKDGSIHKYETLIRLIDRSGEIITPFHFLEIAKKAKLYKQLTRIVIHKAFEAFKDNDFEFSINITIDDILDEDISTYIIDTLKKYNISNRVIFEIVESESIENFDAIEKFIIMIKSFGCRISIDDFGTGYSNFEHLMRLQADFIKIDGSIIKEITKDKRSALITSVIVAFAKEMNIETIGEFVESKEINDKLISLGVNKSQGYYFDRPLKSIKK